MKKSIFLKNSKYWICGFEYNMYEEFVNYIKNNNNNDDKYLNYYHYFDHYDGDILFLFCRSVPKKIRGGIFGYCILDGESKENKSEGKYISVFKDNLIDRCYSKIKEIKKVNNSDQFLTLEELFAFNNLDITHKSFSGKYIKKFLRMENIPENIGDYILKIFDEKIKSYDNNKKTISNSNNDSDSESDNNSYSDNESDSNSNDNLDNEIENESESESDDYDKKSLKINTKEKDKESLSNDSEYDSDSSNYNSDNEDDKENDEENDENPEDIDNKNGLVPIMIELCKKFEFPVIKYDKKKYNVHNNPDIIEKCNYLKKHVITCDKCNIINNNKLDLSYLLNESKISFKEFQETNAELDEAIEKYQNCQKFDGFGYDLDKIHIKINYITDNQNIYDNCVLLYTTLKSLN